MKPSPERPPRPFRKAALTGLGAMLVVLAVTCMSGLTLYVRSCDALRSEVRGNLIRTATAAAALVDGDAHRQFVSPAQETSAAYRAAIDPLGRVLKSSDDIKFVYTCVLTRTKCSSCWTRRRRARTRAAWTRSRTSCSPTPTRRRPCWPRCEPGRPAGGRRAVLGSVGDVHQRLRADPRLPRPPGRDRGSRSDGGPLRHASEPDAACGAGGPGDRPSRSPSAVGLIVFYGTEKAGAFRQRPPERPRRAGGAERGVDGHAG